jgi:glutaminase
MAITHLRHVGIFSPDLNKQGNSMATSGVWIKYGRNGMWFISAGPHLNITC